MNGGVNGSMEEVMEVSHPTSPKGKQLTSEDNELDNCSETSTSAEIPNTEEGEDSQSESPMENQCNISTEPSPAAPDTESTRSADIENDKFDGENSETEELQHSNVNLDNKETHNNNKAEKESLDEEDTTASTEDKSEDVGLNLDIQNDICDEDSSKENETKVEDTDIEFVENEDNKNDQNGESQDYLILDGEDGLENAEVIIENNIKIPVPENKVQLRRSSRAIKRKRYDDDLENGNDVSDEAVHIEDNLRRKSRPIVISDPKSLVQMAVKQMKGNVSSNQKKETTVVILDTNAITQNKPIPIKNANLLSAHNYMNYVGRGTSITPVSAKTNSSIQSSSSGSAQPLILPSLTDDMFVVEAPSFIVPYVYEKPSIKPFREFVDLLGNELEKQKSKEEKDSAVDKDKLDANKDEKVDEEKSEAEAVTAEAEKGADKEELKEQDEDKEHKEEKKKSKEEKKAEKRKKGNEDDDDASWDGESSTESDDEAGSDDEEKTVVIKDKADLSDELKDVTRLPVDKVVCGKSDNYFDCSLGKFFMDIGLNLVQEFVQNDLLKQQNRKLSREKRAGHNTRATETSIASLMKNLEISQEKNSPYRHKQNKCEFCSFKSESMLVMLHHLETPHMKNSVYKCNYCSFEIRSPHDILYHMEAEHNVRGKLERAPAYHQCANCPFEDNGKGKLARHLLPCSRKFKPETNLAPPIEWEPPAKIPKITRSRNNMMGTYQSAFNRGGMGVRTPIPGGLTPVGAAGAFRARGRSPLLPAPRAALPAPVLRGGAIIRQGSPSLLPTNFAANNKGGKCMQQPSISITPLPRQPLPVLPQPAHQNKGSFVICEICDGYIKDLEQLRNHMQWIHKVKIHPKMIYNRPPLNCQKCQCRFFTDQGLERHLLGSHGLVTSSMQEAANKGKDAGRCPVCGRVYQWKLLNHVARDHNLTLKPAHLSYKCTVCTATFGMYKQFESHVYSAHSVVAKRVMDKSKIPPAKPTNDSLLKPLKINDEITIIPQSAKPASAAKQK
ncbi:MOG interacting and ectopic P-granules protein 1 [Papilio machaon]|uniref:MOG interacting and ectopic P-granules protein 1 n=1 Tax=Papilio machaon TaxID=76193 RepID=A0A194QV02_PAPMA|nr:MOG interacting and ectopic P-granules protein 1 [Papilio machaon]